MKLARISHFIVSLGHSHLDDISFRPLQFTHSILESPPILPRLACKEPNAIKISFNIIYCVRSINQAFCESLYLSYNNGCLETLPQKGLSEPVLNGVLVYNFEGLLVILIFRNNLKRVSIITKRFDTT